MRKMVWGVGASAGCVPQMKSMAAGPRFVTSYCIFTTGELPLSVEGYSQAEWVLIDYADFLVHIFSPKARDYYALERLWRAAKTLEFEQQPDSE